MMQFQVGDKVRKVGGSYQADGTIVGAFRTLAGEERYVFEFVQPAGMLHIFGPAQLSVRSFAELRPASSAGLMDNLEGAGTRVYRTDKGDLYAERLAGDAAPIGSPPSYLHGTEA